MKLKIGDKVIWRDAWGSDPPREARVKGIEITHGDKYGFTVDEVPWSEVFGRNVVVDLDTCSWAYGFQIQPTKQPDLKGGDL